MNYTFSEQRELVKARAAEVYALFGAEDTRKHQRCIFPDHADRNPSFRLHGDRYICSCSHGDVIDAVCRATGLNHAKAVQWAADRLSGGFTPVAARPKAIPTTTENQTGRYAQKIWNAANRDDAFVAGHLYSQKKNILHAFGAGRAEVSGTVSGLNADCIVIPIREHGTGAVIAVQAINADGRKQTFGTIGDGYLLLGDERNKSTPWVVVEGWATAHTPRQTVRESVVIISFGAGRMEKVAALVAEHYKPDRLVIWEEPV